MSYGWISKSKGVDFSPDKRDKLNQSAADISFFSDIDKMSYCESEYIITTKKQPLIAQQQVKEMPKPDKERKVVTLSTQEYYFIKQGQL